jgi:hypothetical protein
MIGPIFAHWAIVYIGQLFENYRVGTKFGATLFHGKSYVLIFTKNILPRLLFLAVFTNSSGHPDRLVCRKTQKAEKSI